MKEGHCPGCGVKLFWDWCQDCFKFESGKALPEYNFNGPHEMVAVLTKCSCGEVIEMQISPAPDETEGFSWMPHNISNTDWEAEEHAWDEEY